jgi:acetyltransferase
LANKIGYPVVLKLLSNTITHKGEVGGVYFNVNDQHGVERAFQAIQTVIAPQDFQGVTVQPSVEAANGYELILGSTLDPQFGPVLLFGAGGQLVEVYKDHALGLPPLNTTLARRMMEQTRIFSALSGLGKRAPVDLAALEQLMVRFSQLIVEQRWIKEIEINPLLASPTNLVALDARVILHEAAVTREQLPKLAIRPYPGRYVQSWLMEPTKPVTIRPIRPEDEPLIVKFHQTLSEQSIYFRFLHMLNLTERVAHERLTKICFVDYDREIALVADYRDPATNEHQILGISRLTRLRGSEDAEFALLVNDQVQGRGIGTELLKRLIVVAQTEKVRNLVGDIHPENLKMQRMCRKLGFTLHYSIEEGLTKVSLDLAKS